MNSQNWTISKTFAWEGGHVVHNQALNRPALSVTTKCQCKSLHGHSYSAIVSLSANNLNDQGMVLDFLELGFVKQFIDEVLDHKFILDLSTPNFKIITSLPDKHMLDLRAQIERKGYCQVGDSFRAPDDGMQEHWESFVVVDFVPTSENICKWLHGLFQAQLGTIANVSAIELWETAKSHCRYQP